MHSLTFRVPADLAAPMATDLARAAIGGGHDRAPTPTQVRLLGDHLTLARDVTESGPCYIPWNVDRVGRLMVPTTTLMARERKYHLAVELARGKINQVRNQHGEWQGGGLDPAPEVEAQLREATRILGTATMADPGPNADREANRALTAAFEAADALIARYQDQVYRLRHQRLAQFDTALGVRLRAKPPEALAAVYERAFNAVCIPLTWRDIEPTVSNYRWDDVDAIVAWAVDRGLRVFAGPLVDFSPAGLPDYVLHGDADPVTIRSLMSDYVETVVARYRKSVSRWLVATNSNGSGVMGLAEEDLIRLTAMAADSVWQIDQGLQVVFGVVQPWGDYLAGGGFEYSPFVFADTLLRAGLPFAGIEVDLPMGYGPRGTYCRDLLEMSRLLDLFGLLGVPVQLTMGYPSSPLPDDRCAAGEYAGSAGWWHDLSSSAQADWGAKFVGLAACKSYVPGIFWDHFQDADPHRVPNGGLVDPRGMIKPALDRLRAIREEHLR